MSLTVCHCRTIPPHIRRALEERDRGCRFPGCAGRFTEAHHIRHWADASLAPASAENSLFSNGAALFPDAAIPWDIEAAAREAVEEKL